MWTLIAIWAAGLFATFTQLGQLNHRMVVGFAGLDKEIGEFRDEIAGARANIADPRS